MRESGILLPISSLPSKYGIGCFDKEAYRFVDKLCQAKQTYWQILPLGITSYGDSPYQSYSTYAGNPYFISLDALVENGWLHDEDLPALQDNHSVDYTYLYNHRYALLKKAYKQSNIQDNKDFIQYCEESSWWLDDYALFMAIKNKYEGKCWEFWSEELRLRMDNALKVVYGEVSDEVIYHKFLQYVFWKQWKELKAYANSKGVKIIGDIPIYIAFDSADVWANPELFQLDADVKPVAVAGCPPDGFSATGQLWGNPLYNWDKHRETGYAWWTSRMNYCREYYDVVRIDHFRGFDEYYSIPYGDDTAVNGHWEKGPGAALFKAIEDKLGKMNVIAEDLGYLTDTVKQMVIDTGYPGMKLLQFGFDSRDSSGAALYQPHNYIENSIVYTGTHDNETMMGWFGSILPEEKQQLKDYMNKYPDSDEVLLDDCIELIMACVSKICIVPMQDWLKLGNEARINIPSTTGCNWKWRMGINDFNDDLIKHIAEVTLRNNRKGSLI